MTREEFERLIDRAAERAATVTINRLKSAGRIRYYRSDSFAKTEELLYLYPKLAPDNDMRGKVDQALKRIESDEYAGVIPSKYFDCMTYEEIAGIYGCQPKNIGKQRSKLIKILAAELFPEDVLEEIIKQ